MLEVADIIRAAGPAYREACGPGLLPSHRRALDDLATCRTAAQGGHLRRCDRCEETQYRYHSCRNRHCPKCHSEQTRRWLDRHRTRLLPCPYFLVTFTLPETLRTLARSHQRTVYDACLRAAADTLLTLAADPQHLGARPAILAVLHTWTQDLRYHPHVHVLITGGGLAPDGTRWVPTARPDFLFPGYVLSPVFRGKMRDAVRRAGLLDQIALITWTRDWVVHVQSAGSGHHVLEYLGRYVFRIAITNRRLEHFADGRVTFRFRDRRTRQLTRRTLSAPQFLARFLQHVLQRGFAKVRHYGLASPTCRRQLETARALLPPAPTLIASSNARHDPVPTVDAE
ncbi:MAG: transposase, partial [Armatimonadetes bacterium]|nr:transposase [Armatimonadota bacterium]